MRPRADEERSGEDRLTAFQHALPPPWLEVAHVRHDKPTGRRRIDVDFASRIGRETIQIGSRLGLEARAALRDERDGRRSDSAAVAGASPVKGALAPRPSDLFGGVTLLQ